jgi:hypothetical protein
MGRRTARATKARSRYHGQNRRFDDVEPELRGDYQRLKGKSRFAWEDAKAAARAAWDRVERALPATLHDDGRSVRYTLIRVDETHRAGTLRVGRFPGLRDA